MISIENTQGRIKTIVQAYKDLFPNEYAIAVKAVEMQRRIQRDEYSTTGVQTLQRAILETPENLYTMISQQLDRDELLWFTTKEAKRWFAGAFPEFSLAQKI